ncbi:TIGR03619 family F420-dependent LLM class oxidoreductase [Solirubrobacter soli]|uniref:TIGR03619 family F420-dependent LLM class oxidoreductase n=1 Tax=Solirubrobacter soli TaxID=363832 RepID=UPI00146C72C4|nr:TIGR03619 family F420-dependent LLM class oxidoreductase [Solirubrobacter soli]
MRISVSLPYPDADAEAADPAATVTLAQAVEAAGLDAVAATDHPFPYTAPGRAGHQALDPFVLFGYLAQATTRLALHFNLIVVPYRNPFLTARMVATLDHLSGGRVIASVGAGYMREEFAALGMPFSGRGAALDAGVAAMRAAWSGGRVDWEGEGFRAEGNVMWPVSSPPLWRGGNTRRAIESAVASFDGWSPFEAGEDTSVQTNTAAMSLDTLPARMELLRSVIEGAGRTAPLDVCLVRPSPGWMKDRTRAIETLQELEALGITWLTTHVLGRSGAERLEGVETLREIAEASGVRARATPG